MLSKPTNVIELNMNAEAFNHIAVKSLDRFNYSKALRYFTRASRLEPKNPRYHYNVAGVLTKMGDYAASNEVLQQLLEDDVEGAVDSHYYLACNYAHMDLLEEAEEHAMKYLEQTEDGKYIADIRDLLDYVGVELDRPWFYPMLQGDMDEKTKQHEQARKLLEEGNFVQAEKILVQLEEDHPDFIAAKNNLALCYYYMGDFPKAEQTILSVLEQDPDNLHGLCNLAVLYFHNQDKGNLEKLLSNLAKVIPLQYDQAYKLGITLGVLGEHKSAFLLFKQLTDYAWHLDFHLFHYCAVAAYNIGRYKEAKKNWKLVCREDPESGVAPFYLQFLEEGNAGEKQEIPYYYGIPMELQEASKANQKQIVTNDPFVRSSFLWALRHGDKETKLQVLQAFEWLGDQEVVETLLQFLEDPNEDEELKRLALFVLKTLGHSV
ncbi:tetratricopeptide repeat protein [Ammoniphilus resinae]|uniref:Tetratricopeptide (TPR) repeat protein n=1 Tax=Ammoniphilus resinae TaxID=861532 RepID=A0ABS4GR52_9BACL|nr:tetratricopeptide repeat protein [Ammoniphilus resinae]MBP1932607.1 tetratricopeptide (TPR) repeat protein [Ammoniphilus resinae]